MVQMGGNRLFQRRLLAASRRGRTGRRAETYNQKIAAGAKQTRIYSLQTAANIEKTGTHLSNIATYIELSGTTTVKTGVSELKDADDSATMAIGRQIGTDQEAQSDGNTAFKAIFT